LQRLGFTKVKALGVGSLLDQPVPVEGDDHDVIVYPLDDDPLMKDKDGKPYPVPQSVLDDSEGILRWRDFDHLFMAHEVPLGTAARFRRGEAPPLQLIAPAPKPQVDTLNRVMDGVDRGARRVASATNQRVRQAVPAMQKFGNAAVPLMIGAGAILLPALLAGGLVMATAATVAAAPVAVMADPILIGAIGLNDGEVPDGSPVLYIQLAKWDWPVSSNGLPAVTG